MNEEIHIQTASDERLEVVINNAKPVLLTDLTASLFALGNNFQNFIETEAPRGSGIKGELYVKDVRSGSIIVELVAHALPIAPMLWSGGAIVEWAAYVKDLLLWALDRGEKPQRNITTKELNALGDIIAPIANDNGAQINLNAIRGGRIVLNVGLDSRQARKVQKRIQHEKAALEEPARALRQKRVMTWYQARFDKNSTTGNRARIEAIHNKPLRVLFENDQIKEQMYAQGGRFGRPWQELAYIVDVEVQTIHGIPTVAMILDFYPDETFDPQE